VNVRLQNRSEDAQVSGSLNGEIRLEMVAQNINLDPGEILLTSGLGGNFPADVVVGQIQEIEKTETELFQTALIQPTVDFDSLRAVLVIANFQTININPLIPTPLP